MNTTPIPRWAHLWTFLTQVVLAVIMILISVFFGPGGFHTPVTLVLAGITGALAVLYPMRLREEKGSARIFVMAFILLIIIFIMLVALDVGSRYLPQRPPLTG